jgi:hypothetical protein
LSWDRNGAAHEGGGYDDNTNGEHEYVAAHGLDVPLVGAHTPPTFDWPILVT